MEAAQLSASTPETGKGGWRGRKEEEQIGESYRGGKTEMKQEGLVRLRRREVRKIRWSRGSRDGGGEDNGATEKGWTRIKDGRKGRRVSVKKRKEGKDIGVGGNRNKGEQRSARGA